MTDRKRAITVKTFYKSKEGIWPVDIEFQIGVGGEKIAGAMDTICLWLGNHGFTPRFELLGSVPDPTLPQPGQEGTYGAVAAPPLCPVHQSPMKESQFQPANGTVQWFCPVKQAGGYCKEMAKV